MLLVEITLILVYMVVLYDEIVISSLLLFCFSDVPSNRCLPKPETVQTTNEYFHLCKYAIFFKGDMHRYITKFMKSSF